MKQQRAFLALILAGLFVTSLTSCEAIAGIFKAGVWTGIILVVIIVAAIIFLITRISRK